MNYLLFLPADYEEDVGKMWPLILFLHGWGERGNTLDDLELGYNQLVSDGERLERECDLDRKPGALGVEGGVQRLVTLDDGRDRSPESIEIVE